MSKQHLIDALEWYQEYEEYAQKLRHLVEEDDEIALKWPTTDIAALHRIEEAISTRIHDINDQIERAGNQSMDKFIRRQV